jgi:hypothetical protein
MTAKKTVSSKKTAPVKKVAEVVAQEPVADPSVANLVIDGKTFSIASLSPEVQELVVLYQRWGNERTEAQIEVAKCEAAQRAISVEISNRLSQPTS